MDALNPDYYRPADLGFECIDLTERYTFNTGNCLKYMFRLDDKDTPRKNAGKARWYAQRAMRRGEPFRPVLDGDIPGAARMLRTLAERDHQHAAPFWTAMLGCLTGDADGDDVAATLGELACRIEADNPDTSEHKKKEEGR